MPPAGVPGSIDEIEVPRREPHALLDLEAQRDTPDPEFYRWGYGWVGPLRLDATDGGAVATLSRALVVALHAADVQPDEPGALDLEFDIDLDETGDDFVAIVVPAARFLEARLAALVAGATAGSDGTVDVVLALCNPRRVAIARPAGLSESVRLWWAEGDVESWLDPTPRGDGFRLTALRWHAAAPQ